LWYDIEGLLFTLKVELNISLTQSEKMQSALELNDGAIKLLYFFNSWLSLNLSLKVLYIITIFTMVLIFILLHKVYGCFYLQLSKLFQMYHTQLCAVMKTFIS
jgi:hypothetical protein